jgi:hypothetical protein
MSFLAQIKARIRSTSPAGQRRIAVFGDSHTAALISARDFPDRRHRYSHIRIHRVLKQKNGRSLGNSTLEDFCEEISDFGPDDLVFSAVGGNQYAVISTVQDPVDYDFLGSPDDTHKPRDGAELVPFRALESFLRKGVRGTIGPVLRTIRNSTSARVFHLAPPPPKQDNAFITRHFESRFADEGMHALGPTRPSLRLRSWIVQLQCLESLCSELNIGLVKPPKHGVTDKGYLAPNCYAKDVTHANRRYGEFVLKQILELAEEESQAK